MDEPEKIIEKRACRKCDNDFSITSRDQSFYSKINVPFPTHCPDCRMQRRLLHVNQVNLFRRTCHGTGQTIISNYHPSTPCRVYSQSYWHSDKFDGTEYGRDFDFRRSFFEQYAQLSHDVPRPALFTDYVHDENCEYTNYAGRNKNCYLIFDSDESWDCYYSYGMYGSKNSSDCYRVQKLELCYEVVDSFQCYNCQFTYNSEVCVDSAFLNNCIGCNDCIMCSNLHHKEYWIRNKPANREQVEQLRQSFASYQALEGLKKEFAQFRLAFPQRYMRGTHNEEVTGNHLVHSKQAYSCFDSMNLWDAKYCVQTFIGARDLFDCSECGDGELFYESSNSGYNAHNIRFSHHCLSQISNLTYCSYCFNGCSDLFGCLGLKRKQFCVLNKQYSKADYLELTKKIIRYMQEETKEWGEFFPASLSAFPYNLSMAQEHFPLTENEALTDGYLWLERDREEFKPATFTLPDEIKQTPESVTKELLSCADCGKNYRIIPQELKLYQTNWNIPLPRQCFSCRHQARLRSRTPRKLWHRSCAQCSNNLATAYAPERPEIVYCETCYLGSLI